MRAINADKLLQTGGFFHDIDDCEYWTKEDINAAPTIDPSSLVKRGRWGEYEYYENMPSLNGFPCSVCGQHQQSKTPHCPICGARMQED